MSLFHVTQDSALHVAHDAGAHAWHHYPTNSSDWINTARLWCEITLHKISNLRRLDSTREATTTTRHEP
jgi:hypothetical protein